MNAPANLGEENLEQKVRMAANGRVVLPKALRDAVGIERLCRPRLEVRDVHVALTPPSGAMSRDFSIRISSIYLSLIHISSPRDCS